MRVSGSPGTSKPALVNSVIVSVEDITPEISIMFLNCMAITDMDELWKRLAEELVAVAAPAKKVQGREEVNALLADEKSDFKW